MGTPVGCGFCLAFLLFLLPCTVLLESGSVGVSVRGVTIEQGPEWGRASQHLPPEAKQAENAGGVSQAGPAGAFRDLVLLTALGHFMWSRRRRGHRPGQLVGRVQKPRLTRLRPLSLSCRVWDTSHPGLPFSQLPEPISLGPGETLSWCEEPQPPRLLSGQPRSQSRATCGPGGAAVWKCRPPSWEGLCCCPLSWGFLPDVLRVLRA